MEPHRLRLKFDDSVLNDSQKLEGLKRSWVLVDPEHQTISDFVSHLLDSFNLWNTCPHGIFLSMEGFALPYFESIAILKGNDLVCVKRMGSKLLDGMNESWEGLVEGKGKQKLRLTPNEEFEKETGGYLSEAEVDEEDNLPNGVAPIKKRKTLKQLKSSKKKRKCKTDESSSSGKENADFYVQNGCSQKMSQNSKEDQVDNALCTNVDNWNEIVTLSSEPNEIGRVSVSRSRSTKCKRAQRLRQQTLRIPEQALMQAQGEYLDDVNHTKELQQESKTDDEIVPVVVRPGHIRFAAPGKEKDVQQCQEAEGSFNWRGIMKKKEGQKRGKEKQSLSKWNEDKHPCKKQSASKWNDCRSTEDKQPASKWNEQSANTWGGNRSNGVRQSGPKWNGYRANGRNWATQKAPQANPSMEFEKMVPMVDFPVQGDIIAYRVLEMSSSLIPELTAYRVGKVSCSDPEANTVKLVPVPEYPFEFKKASNCISDELDDASRYKEDGSLEIDFPSLADVRIVKHKTMDTSTSFHQMANATPSSGWTVTNAWASPSTPVSGWGSTLTSGWRTETPGSINWTGTNTAVASTSGTSENGSKDVWEEMSAAMIAKREERLKEDNWNKKPKPVNYSWSHKIFRGRAQTRRGSN